MTASVPAFAPATPPLTGESTQATPRSPAARATTPATLGPVVDRSISVFTVEPFRIPLSFTLTACTTGGVGRLMKTTDAVDATSSADAATIAPRAANGFTTSAFVSKTQSECPASSRREAIGPPMRPTPTNPNISLAMLLPWLVVGGSCLTTNHQLSLNKRIRNVRRRRDPDALHLKVFLDHLLPALAAEARSLVAPERREVTDGAIGVDPDRPRLKLAGHRQRPPHVLRPHTGGESVDHVVADGDRLVLIAEGNHRQDRTKDLFLRDPHAVADALEDRRLDEDRKSTRLNSSHSQ